MTIYTIGYGGKNAEDFFQTLTDAGVKTLLDVRLYNTSQLAGFTKRDDLKFFLKTLCQCEYRHLKELAPAPGLLDGYKKQLITWAQYETEYNRYLSTLTFNHFLSKRDLASGCFLCAEPTPEQCHRRLIVEYIQAHMTDVSIVHL